MTETSHDPLYKDTPVCSNDINQEEDTMTHMEYTTAQREARLALRHYDQPRTYTTAHFTAWCELADERYSDTPYCVNADLRTAFVKGCIFGYEFVLVYGSPSCYDRLQQDAFMDGVKHGENAWSEDHANDDDQPVSVWEDEDLDADFSEDEIFGGETDTED